MPSSNPNYQRECNERWRTARAECERVGLPWKTLVSRVVSANDVLSCRLSVKRAAVINAMIKAGHLPNAGAVVDEDDTLGPMGDTRSAGEIRREILRLWATTHKDRPASIAVRTGVDLRYVRQILHLAGKRRIEAEMVSIGNFYGEAYNPWG